MLKRNSTLTGLKTPECIAAKRRVKFGVRNAMFSYCFCLFTLKNLLLTPVLLHVFTLFRMPQVQACSLMTAEKHSGKCISSQQLCLKLLPRSLTDYSILFISITYSSIHAMDIALHCIHFTLIKCWKVNIQITAHFRLNSETVLVGRFFLKQAAEVSEGFLMIHS